MAAEVLGLPVLKRWKTKDGESDRSVWVAIGNAFLAIERREDGEAASVGYPLIAFAILPSERAVWEGRLSSAGVPLVRRTDYTIYFQDLDGNRIGLSHFPEAAPK